MTHEPLMSHGAPFLSPPHNIAASNLLVLACHAWTHKPGAEHGNGASLRHHPPTREALQVILNHEYDVFFVNLCE